MHTLGRAVLMFCLIESAMGVRAVMPGSGVSVVSVVVVVVVADGDDGTRDHGGDGGFGVGCLRWPSCDVSGKHSGRKGRGFSRAARCSHRSPTPAASVVRCR